mgnify:CR=1 FL=1
MPLLEDTLDAMETRARSFKAKILVVDVRGGATSHDPDLGRRRDMLAISVVLSMPSDSDGRYRLEEVGRLFADSPEVARASMVKAHELAERLDVTLHPESAEPPTADVRGWIAQQGPPPARSWVMQWSTKVWRPDGTTAHEQGEQTVEAESGNLAHYAASREIVRNLAPPFFCTIASKELGRPGGTYYMASYPASLPAKDTFRALARAGRPLSAILRGMLAESAGLTPLDRMVALEHVFLIELDALAPVGAFCRGELSDSELDRAMEPVITDRKPRWSCPLALREAHAKGQSVGPVLHAHYRELGVLQLIIAMRDAFDLSLLAAKAFVGTACDGKHDDDLVIMLDGAVRAIAAGRRDDYRAMDEALESRK